MAHPEEQLITGEKDPNTPQCSPAAMQKFITGEKELHTLQCNLAAMQKQFKGNPLSGENLYQLLKKIQENHDFSAELKRQHPVLHEALTGSLLPSWGTVYRYTTGGKQPTLKIVQDIAAFCTKAFSFDEAVTADDFLHTDLTASFPPLRRENERWNRYVGLYRGFYIYPDSLAGDDLQIHGALLQLREDEGKLLVRMVTGIRQDVRFAELEDIFSQHLKETFFENFKTYNDSLPEYEGRLVCYEGKAEFDIPNHFLLRLHRVNHQNAALLLLRRWEKSAQRIYSGGVAAVTLCRGDDMTGYAMAITRHAMSLTQEKELLQRHLCSADMGVKGVSLDKKMDKYWNQAVMDWGYRQSLESE